ncbi:MAG: hypothetical protein MI742_16255 [Desulfobacterales bacterium]|nr:hypothetical protein [Desulfobacterales bacterium]
MKAWLLSAALLMVMMVTACAPPQYNPRKKPVRISYENAVDGQLSSLSTQVAKQLTRRRIRRVAVKEFTRIDGKRKQLEKYLEMEVSDKLFKTGYFTIINSEMLDQTGEKSILGLIEGALVKNSDIKAEDARKAGRALNIDSIVVGRTVVLDNAVKLTIQLISTTKGAVFGSASTLISKDKNIRRLIGEKAAGQSYLSGQKGGGYESNGLYGQFIHTGENQFHELVPDLFTLYVKQVNQQLDPFSETGSNVEVFLNDEYKVINVGEMISFTVDDKTYVLTVRKISGRKAVFSFARLRNAADDEPKEPGPPAPTP